MRDIDEMDMLGFLKIRAWQVKRAQEKRALPAAPRRFIDEVWPKRR